MYVVIEQTASSWRSNISALSNEWRVSLSVMTTAENIANNNFNLSSQIVLAITLREYFKSNKTSRYLLIIARFDEKKKKEEIYMLHHNEEETGEHVIWKLLRTRDDGRDRSHESCKLFYLRPEYRNSFLLKILRN